MGNEIIILMASQIGVSLGLAKTPWPSSSSSSSINIPIIVKATGNSINFVVKKSNRVNLKWAVKSSSSAAADKNPNGGIMSVEKVDMVLDEVRPYLISDGGNVDVVSVLDGVISLQLTGACGSCPSSTTTMKMGIERVLKEKFGDAVKEIRQVENGEPVNETTVEGVNRHLDILRPAIKNYGGEVDVIAIEEGNCTVRYDGPDSIGSGIKAAIKEKFPEIVNVIFTK